MRYINDPNKPFQSYDNVVNAAIKSGVDPKRAYIYLAAMGVKGDQARVISSDGQSYLPAFKVAVKNGSIVTKVTVCKNCGSLKIV